MWFHFAVFAGGIPKEVDVRLPAVGHDGSPTPHSKRRFSLKIPYIDLFGGEGR